MSSLALTLNNTYDLEQEENLTAITNEIIDAYARQLDTSESTKKTYLACLKKFANWLDQEQVSCITYELLVDYKNYLRTMYKPKAINTHLTAIKDLYKYLERKGFNNIAKYLKKEKVTKDFEKESLTAEQVKGILANIDTSTLDGARANALFRLLIGTGLRECEIVRADIKDLGNKNGQSILYVQGKGRTQKNEFVVITYSVMQALQDYFIKRGAAADEPLFTSNSDRNNGQRITTRTVQRIVKGLYAANGIINERITTHSTRHTAISLAADNGADIKQVQAMARHKDINTTMIYYHNKTRLENNAESKLEQLFSN